MGKPSVSRRKFIHRAAAASTAIALPAFVPATVLGRDGSSGANEQVLIGFIGTGGRARLAPQVAAGHELMLLAALSQVPLPGDLAALLEPAQRPEAAPFQAPVRLAESRAPTDRWSADAWVLLRRDTTTAVTSGRGSYGQSQAGAVIRYHLAPSSGFRPTAYLRASQALAADRESEAAFGLAARPIPGGYVNWR